MSLTEHPRILLADDEPQITRVLRTLLSAHGYDVRVANDGEAALQVAGDVFVGHLRKKSRPMRRRHPIC